MKLQISGFNADSIKKGLNYIKFNGVSGIVSKVRYRMTGPGLAYNGWYKEGHEADEEELTRQRDTHFEYEPVITIIVPVYLTPEYYLRAMIESVQRQTYGKWQLCIVDGSQAETEEGHQAEEKSVYDKVYSLETESTIRQYLEEDSRIDYILTETNLGISDSYNEGIKIARGEYIATLDHDDVLTEDALFHFVQALQEFRYDMIYSDEDKMSEDGNKFSDPAFKPDFDIDLLRSYNYIKHFYAVKKSLVLQVGGFNRDFDGAQDYDLLLRCVEQINFKQTEIKHISRVLYHQRISNKTNAKQKKREYAKEMGKKALSAHLSRLNLFATVSHTEIGGMYKVTYETPGNPFLSIIIPGGRDVSLMTKTLVPLFERARYSNFEIIIIDPDGENKDMIMFYKRMESIRRNIKVIVNTDIKGIAALRNYGASIARGQYLLFLDNNVEIMEPAAMGEMLGACIREEVGVVSGTLYDDNNKICHKGIVVGLNGLATYIYQGVKKGELAYLMHNRINTGHSAVTASCMMVKKEVFQSVGGFSEKFNTELSDIDFCLKVREKNYLITCLADAEWYYHKQEGNNIVEGKFPQEENLFGILWSQVLQNGDPYYNANFTREGDPFSLKAQ